VASIGAVIVAFVLSMTGVSAQADSPARDGEIRAGYDAVLDQSEIRLTIEPRSPDGKPAPAGMVLALARTFDGKAPRGPAALFNVRVTAGVMDAPRAELSLVADSGAIDLAGGNPRALQTTAKGVHLAATIPAETLKRVAAASRITGNALGFPFELTASQREALRTFVARAMSDDPVNAK
jgi:hypothetical protein